jgi:hypothetical protein
VLDANAASTTSRSYQGADAAVPPGACLGSEAKPASRTGQIVCFAAYLRAAQAYMLISMPTDTSTIFGAFQAIRTSLDFGCAITPV